MSGSEGEGQAVRRSAAGSGLRAGPLQQRARHERHVNAPLKNIGVQRAGHDRLMGKPDLRAFVRSKRMPMDEELTMMTRAALTQLRSLKLDRWRQALKKNWPSLGTAGYRRARYAASRA